MEGLDAIESTDTPPPLKRFLPTIILKSVPGYLLKVPYRKVTAVDLISGEAGMRIHVIFIVIFIRGGELRDHGR